MEPMNRITIMNNEEMLEILRSCCSSNEMSVRFVGTDAALIIASRTMTRMRIVTTGPLQCRTELVPVEECVDVVVATVVVVSLQIFDLAARGYR